MINGFNLSKTSFSFFADKNDILIKNILGNLEDIKIFDGDIRLNLDELEEKMFDEGFLVVCLEADEKVDVFFEMEYCLDELLNSLVKITRQNRKGFLCVKISKFPRTVSGKINYNDLRKEQNEFRL